MNWIEITDIEQLQTLDAASQLGPVVIYKHSNRCSIATVAKNRLVNDKAMNDVKVYEIDVVAQRPISLAVAERYGVRHESPQVLVIHGGQSIYDASHLSIFPQEVMERLSSPTQA